MQCHYKTSAVLFIPLTHHEKKLENISDANAMTLSITRFRRQENGNKCSQVSPKRSRKIKKKKGIYINYMIIAIHTHRL